MNKIVSDRPSFQGDIMIRRIDKIPANVTKVEATNGVHILAHSETGHHHVIDSRAAQNFIDKANEFISYLSVATEEEIKHLRDFDTHESLTLPPGNYEIVRQREYVAEGYRPARD